MEAGSWRRVDPVDVPAEGRVRSVTVDGRTVALARCGAELGALLFAADGPAMLHVSQDPELL